MQTRKNKTILFIGIEKQLITEIEEIVVRSEYAIAPFAPRLSLYFTYFMSFKLTSNVILHTCLPIKEVYNLD